MKKIFLYSLISLLGLGAVSCSDNEENMNGLDPTTDFNRMPMTQFRHEETTGTSASSDLSYCSMLVDGELNVIRLAWYGIEGAAGYEIKWGLHAVVNNDNLAIQEANWNNEDLILGHVIVNGNDATVPGAIQTVFGEGLNVVAEREHAILIKDLDYSSQYRFCIRVLHPDGNEEHHSKWYGIASQREWARFLRLETSARYDTPSPVTVGETSKENGTMLVSIDVNFASSMSGNRSKYSSDEQMLEEAKRHFDFVQDGTQDDPARAKFYFDYLTIDAENAGSRSRAGEGGDQMIPIDYSKMVDGKIDILVKNLQVNTPYSVNVINSVKPVPKVDRGASPENGVVWGDPGEPILIEHKVRATDSINGEVEYQACLLDDIFTEFNASSKYAENQVFYLQGDKAYFFFANPTLEKGFVLETLPEDVAAGKRAKVYLGGIGYGFNEQGGLTGSIASCNFMFGRPKRQGEGDGAIKVGSVVFRNIDFDCPLARNFGQGSPQGNYFANMYSNGKAVTFNSFEVYNCNFNHMIRGFFRLQGGNRKIFNKVVIDGCLFYNNGYYDNNGSGYAWFAGDGGQTNTNFYKNFWFTNNTIYDSPRACLISDNNKNISYEASVQWNIHIENNTFVNFSTRTSGRPIINTRYVPGGSYFSVQRNLFVMAAQDGDQREMNMQGSDIREIKGDGTFSFDVKDNYAVGCTDKHLKDDGIFSGAAFSNVKNSFGSTNWKPGNRGTTEDLVVKVLRDNSGNPMKATQLFNNVNPPYKQVKGTTTPNDHKAPEDIFSALKYKTVPATITEKNIGDPRWR